MPPENQTTQAPPQLSEVLKRLNEANNVLVTVSKDPSVDQLSACIGLTIALNKKDKHATAVFSGAVPSTIEFLEPDKTLEKNTDSLRDFIVSLDKNKADKLRYKVENDVVKIFITPYRTSITENDLDFSQGDFNVDAVVALGVKNKEDLDSAIVAHGRILHDATVIAVNLTETGELGSINWQEPKASSLSEMSADLATGLDENILDSQIATAFLTGIVAETDRFRNEKSAPNTMTVAGKLMSAGASTQLVSSKLEEPKKAEPPQGMPAVENAEEPKKQSDDGMIEIDHGDDIHIDDSGQLKKIAEIEDEIKRNEHDAERSDEPASLPEPTESPDAIPDATAHVNNGPSIMTEPPKYGGELTANSRKVDQDYIKAPDPLTGDSGMSGSPQYGGINATLSHSNQPASENQTLHDLEESVNSPHLEQPDMPEGEMPPAAQPQDAREAVDRAVQAGSDYRAEPIQALGANPLGGQINHQPANNMPPPQPDQNNGPPPPPVPPPFPG